MADVLKKLKYKRAQKKLDKEFAGWAEKEGDLIGEWAFYDKNRKFQNNAFKADSLMGELRSVRLSMKNSQTKKRQLKKKYDEN